MIPHMIEVTVMVLKGFNLLFIGSNRTKSTAKEVFIDLKVRLKKFYACKSSLWCIIQFRFRLFLFVTTIENSVDTDLTKRIKADFKIDKLDIVSMLPNNLSKAFD